MDSKPENDEDERVQDAGALGFILAIAGMAIVYLLYLLGVGNA